MKKLLIITAISFSLFSSSYAKSLIEKKSEAALQVRCAFKFIIHLGVFGTYGVEYEIEPCPNDGGAIIAFDNLDKPVLMGVGDFEITAQDVSLNENLGFLTFDSESTNISKLVFKNDVKLINEEMQSITIKKGEYTNEVGQIKIPFTKD